MYKLKRGGYGFICCMYRRVDYFIEIEGNLEYFLVIVSSSFIIFERIFDYMRIFSLVIEVVSVE